MKKQKRTSYRIRKGGRVSKAKTRSTTMYYVKTRKKESIGIIIIVLALLIYLVYYLVTNISFDSKLELYIGLLKLNVAAIPFLVVFLASFSALILLLGAFEKLPDPTIFAMGTTISFSFLILFFYLNNSMTGLEALKFLGYTYSTILITWIIVKKTKKNIYKTHAVMILSMVIILLIFLFKR